MKIKKHHLIILSLIIFCLMFLNVSFATDTNENITNTIQYNDLEVNSTSLHALIINEENKNYTAKISHNNTPVPNFTVSVKVSNVNNDKFKFYNLTTDNEGLFTLPINLAIGTYSIETYPGDYYKYNNHYLLNKDYIGVYSEDTIIPGDRKNIGYYDAQLGNGISVNNNKDLIMNYGENKNFTANIYSLYLTSNIFVKAEFIRLKDNAYRTYYFEAINNTLNIPINLAAGNYKINLYTEYNSPLSTNYILIKDNTPEYYITCDSDTSKYIVGSLKNFNNTNLADKTVTINLTRKSDGISKEYTVSTNTDGYFSLPVNLGIGEYTFSCSYNGTLLYTNKITIKN